jgi:hypothetical protein
MANLHRMGLRDALSGFGWEWLPSNALICIWIDNG